MSPRPRPRRRLAPALSLASCLACTGCYAFSFSLPPAPTEEEQKLVEATHFHASVAVAPFPEDRFEAIALLETLRKTGLFDEVGLLGQVEKPDLIALVEGRADFVPPSSVSQGWTLITLGAFPTIADDQWATVFSLHPRHVERGGDKAGSAAPAAHSAAAEPANGAAAEPENVEGVAIDYRVDGTMHVGLIAAFTGLFSSRTWSPPPVTDRYGQGLAVRLCRRAPEIRAMIEASRRAAAANAEDTAKTPAGDR